MGDTTLQALDGGGTARDVGFVTGSSGEFIPRHAVSNAAGSTVNPATNETLAGLAVAPLSASGIAAVIGSFSSTGQSAAFTPLAGRSFNVSVDGTFAATLQLKRKMPNDGIWRAITIAGTPFYVWSAAFSESVEEDQVGVEYRLECTWTSGTINYRIEQ